MIPDTPMGPGFFIFFRPDPVRGSHVIEEEDDDVEIALSLLMAEELI